MLHFLKWIDAAMFLPSSSPHAIVDAPRDKTHPYSPGRTLPWIWVSRGVRCLMLSNTLDKSGHPLWPLRVPFAHHPKGGSRSHQ